MLTIRQYERADESQVRDLHGAQGFDYALPDLNDEKLWFVRAVMTGHTGKVEVGVFLRRTAETFLLIDPSAGTKRGRLGNILAMQQEVNIAAKRAGLTDAYCNLPPEIPEFGSLLMHVGWKRPLWAQFVREIR